MKVACEAFVDVPVDALWRSLTDVDGVLAVLPDATLTRDADSVTGSLRCQLDAHQVTYQAVVRSDLGSASDVGGAEVHTALLAVTCKEARGGGVLAASITVEARSTGTGTTVDVNGEIEASGRGAAADSDTWAKVLGRLLDAAVSRPVAVARPSGIPTQLKVGMAGAVAVLLAWRLGRRTRR